MWFIGFPTADSGVAPRGGWRWWRWFTRPGYRHVIAWREAEGGGTLFIEHLAGKLVVMHFRQPIEQVTRHYIDHGYWTLAYAAPESLDITRRPPLRPLLTCTEVIKAAIGLRAWCVITPRQLARALRRRGAVPVLPTTLLPPQPEDVTMSAIFSPPKPKGPDEGLIAAQRQSLADERQRAADLEAQKDSRLRAMLGRSQGRVSLLGGAETGVPEGPATTAGADKLR